MNPRGARKSAFLGMPHGTAANRLRKMVMFHLLQKHGENICFQCGEKIATADELSIEHKQPCAVSFRALTLFSPHGTHSLSG